MLNGKTAVVTGGGRGIGRAISRELAAAGAYVIIIYGSDESSAAATADSIEAAGGRAAVMRCDVSDYEATALAAKEITALSGGVDILVNNAGITRDGLVATMSEKNFDDVININLKGAFNMIRHLSRQFIKRSSGRIINISSISGITGLAGQANYSAAKAGLIGLTKAVAKELAPRGITCNAIAPGYIETDMTGALSDKIKEGIIEKIPAGRIGAPADVAKLVLFLAGEGAAYITGEVLRADGGLCM